jgi:hypothetical protein
LKEDAELAKEAAELVVADSQQSVRQSKKILERFKRGQEN